MRLGIRVNFTPRYETLKKRIDDGTWKALGDAGAYLRTVVKSKLKPPTKKAEKNSFGAKPRSPKGTPPYSHKPDRVLNKSIGFDRQSETKSVVVGPRNSKASKIGKLHEFGGSRKVVNGRRIERKIGGSGEIRLGPSVNAKITADWKGKKNLVTYGKIHSDRQAREANRLNKELYGPSKYVGRYPKRPFMGPSLVASEPKLPEFFKEIV